MPAAVFANGPRQVRCARCSFSWLADLPAEIVVMPKEEPESLPAAPPSFVSQTEPHAPVKKAPAVSETESSAPAEAAEISSRPEDVLPVPPASNLPAIWRNPHWRKIRIGLMIAVGLAVLGLLVDMAVSKHLFDGVRSKTTPILKKMGLMSSPVGEGLSLQQIRSERRFEDGGMHLVLDGEIRNDSTETRPVPDIMAKALGPDRNVIESWRIEAPAATLPPGATAPFHSSIVSPQGTVVEINMIFVEPRHD